MVTLISILLAVLVGCAPRMRPGQPLPQPQPSIPVPAPAAGVPTSQSWSFNYQAGITAYQITRKATIKPAADSLLPTPLDSSTNAAHEVLSLERIGDTIQFTLAVDTFTTIVPGRAGAPQLGRLPIELKGQMTRDSLIIAPDSADAQCSTIASVAASDLQNLLIRFPPELTRGLTWQDSVNVKGCQASIPTTVHTRRFFRVMGESPDTESGIVVVERTDSIRAHGEGAQQQHRVVLDAIGSGTAVYYLSTADGRVLRATGDQELELTVTTSENAARFRQRLRQELALIR